MMLRKGARPVPVASRYRRLPGRRFSDEQGPGGLAADEDALTRLDVLQARCERSVRDLDAVKLEVLVVVGARQAEGAEQRAAVDLQPQHHEVPVLEAEGGVARRGEAEERVVPVVDVEDLFLVEGAHGGGVSPVVGEL